MRCGRFRSTIRTARASASSAERRAAPADARSLARPTAPLYACFRSPERRGHGRGRSHQHRLDVGESPIDRRDVAFADRMDVAVVRFDAEAQLFRLLARDVEGPEHPVPYGKAAPEVPVEMRRVRRVMDLV